MLAISRSLTPISCAIALVLLPLGISFAQGEAPEEFDPPEVTIGERLFLETRFSQAFKAFLDRGYGVNNPESPADPSVDKTVTLGAPLKGPFAGKSMNCRACHLVDEHLETTGGGMRTYADFARKSPVPLRMGDPQRVTPRNSPALVNASLARPGFSLHLDGEFASLEDLVRGTFTGRNMGWLPSEQERAVAHIARIIREDNGQGELAADFGNLSYRSIFAGQNSSIPAEYRLPEEFRLNVSAASDDEILDAVASLVAAYVRQLVFSQDDAGQFNLSPFDVFLQSNSLPRKLDEDESPLEYSQRLLDAVDSLDAKGQLKLVDVNPATEDGKFKSHDQAFVFGAAELAGFRAFFSRPAGAAASSQDIAKGGIGNCVACHAAPNFTDFTFHNTGVSQVEYDGIHGAGMFAKLPIPTLNERNSTPEAYLPATGKHPHYGERFRLPAERAHPDRIDLGLWNIYANPDVPNPQASLQSLLCKDVLAAPGNSATPVNRCAAPNMLEAAIARFKTPGLRDLSHSAPYMHNGAQDSLEAVLNLYLANSIATRAGTIRNPAPELGRIAIRSADIAAIAAFLRSLNEDYE